MLRFPAVALLGLAVWCGSAAADEVTWTCVNFSQSTVSGSAAGFQFANCINVLVTNNTNGDSVMLTAIDSGSTGGSTHFDPGPPLEADYRGAGANSVLVEANGHVFLAGHMEDGGRLEANYPDKAGAFLSRFVVDTVDTAVLAQLGTGPRWAPEGSVSLTLAETTFDGVTLGGTLGGGEFTITTVAPVSEATTLLLFGTGTLAAVWMGRRQWR